MQFESSRPDDQRRQLNEFAKDLPVENRTLVGCKSQLPSRRVCFARVGTTCDFASDEILMDVNFTVLTGCGERLLRPVSVFGR